ncbi:hypothetical protein [Streptomyces umbrinus]|uniref:hypothetical protein n=1 Tax=Streptomyces umbrinus TaxID=67370 RepID=UPI003C2ED837
MAALADPDLPLTSGLADALERVAEMHPECDLSNPGTPSATVAILRHRHGALDHLVLADSPIIFGTPQGYSVITDLRVDDVLPEMKAEVERHETHTEGHREALQLFVLAQRQVRNTARRILGCCGQPRSG